MSRGGFSCLKGTRFMENYPMLVFVVCAYLPIGRGGVSVIKNSIENKRSKYGVKEASFV